MVNSNEFNTTKAATKGDQFTSFNVDDFQVPSGRDEVWRDISLRSLRGLHDGTFSDVVEQKISVSEQPGVSSEKVNPDDSRLGRAGAPADRVAAQAWTSMPAGQVVTIDGDKQYEDAVVITITGAGEDVTSFGATSVEVGKHAEVTIVLNYQGSGTHADNVEFVIGDGANVNVVVDADWEDDAVHLSHQIASLGRDATLRHNAAIFGGEIVRMVPRVSFTAPGGDAELLGVYYASEGQYFENRLLMDHSQPSCRSNVMYKGAIQGAPGSSKPDARSCWVGDILIRSNAENTDTYEVNRNLLLTDGARADAIPNLEIETGEIAGAGHAATVGRFDDEQVYYLMSRGIPEGEARRLIIRGFFLEIINRIPVQSLREDLAKRVDDELATISA